MTSVMIVDDNDAFREECANLLRDNGFEVSQAVNGQDAVHRFRMDATDAVILDLDMPVWDGIRAAQVLSTLDPRVRVIFMSGDPVKLKSAAEQVGLSLICLPKTIDPNKLISLIKVLF